MESTQHNTNTTVFTFKAPESLTLATISPMTGAFENIPNEILMMIIDAVGPHDRKVLSALCFILSCRTTLQLYAKSQLTIRISKPQGFSTLFLLQTIGPGQSCEDHWTLCYFCVQFVRKDANEGRVFTAEEHESNHDRLMHVSDFYWYWSQTKLYAKSQNLPWLLCAKCLDLFERPINTNARMVPGLPRTLPWTRRPDSHT